MWSGNTFAPKQANTVEKFRFWKFPFGALVHRLLNPLGSVAGQLAVVQGASEAPLSGCQYGQTVTEHFLFVLHI